MQPETNNGSIFTTTAKRMLDWFQDKSLTVLERPSLNSDFNPPKSLKRPNGGSKLMTRLKKIWKEKLDTLHMCMCERLLHLKLYLP